MSTDLEFLKVLFLVGQSINIPVSLLMGHLAGKRDRSASGFFLLSLFIGFLIPWIILLILPTPKKAVTSHIHFDVSNPIRGEVAWKNFHSLDSEQLELWRACGSKDLNSWDGVSEFDAWIKS